MTRTIALPAHVRTYLALSAVALVAFYCAHLLYLVPGALVLVLGLGAVWGLGRTQVSADDEAVSVREFGLLGGVERIPYEAILAVRTRDDEDDEMVVLEFALAERVVRVGPWQSFFRQELLVKVDEVAREIRLRRARGAEHKSRAAIPSVA